MRQERQAVATEEYDAHAAAYTAQEGENDPVPRVLGMTILASRKVTQITERSCDVVIASDEKGRFLVRRRKDRSADECPLLSFEIRRIANGDPCNQAADSTCEARSPQWGCERDTALGRSSRMAARMDTHAKQKRTKQGESHDVYMQMHRRPC